MRYCVMNTETDQVVPAPPPDEPIPNNIMFAYVPRIRCLDCPGKLYTPGPDTTVTNFEVHLKNRQHREKVDNRVGRSTAPGRPALSSTAIASAQS
jgi:SWI/SNF-related matrix-associated actin-dependent regulator of chromatin subfamily B member 1